MLPFVPDMIPDDAARQPWLARLGVAVFSALGVVIVIGDVLMRNVTWSTFVFGLLVPAIVLARLRRNRNRQ